MAEQEVSRSESRPPALETVSIAPPSPHRSEILRPKSGVLESDTASVSSYHSERRGSQSLRECPTSPVSETASVSRLSRFSFEVSPSGSVSQNVNTQDPKNLGPSPYISTEEIFEKDALSRRMWNPLWLSASVLVAFIICIFALFVTVLTLYLYSQAHDGIRNASDNLYYAWTYVPTAIFVLIASLWRRVDFYSKELTPYQRMRGRAAPADRSLLLDYIDPVLPLSLWKALMNRDWAVFTSNAMSVLFRLCIILSSGLLVLQRTRVSIDSENMFSTSIFNGSRGADRDNENADSVVLYYGSKAQNLPWAYGVTENLTVQTFEYDETQVEPDTIIMAEVSGISITSKCDEAKIGEASLVSRPWAANGEGIFARFLVANISGPGCELQRVSLGQTPGHYTLYVKNRTSDFQGNFNYYACNTGFDFVGEGFRNNTMPNATTSEDYRFVVSMSEVTWDLMSVDDRDQGDNYTIAKATALLCKPSFSLDNYTVELAPYNKTLNSATKIPDTSRTVEGFGLEDLMNAMDRAIEFSTFGGGGEDFVITPVKPMFQLLAALNGGSRQEPLIETQLLEDLTNQALQGIGAQYAHLYLKQAQRQPVPGVVTMTVTRIHIKQLTFALMITALSMLILSGLIFFVIRPRNVAPCATESLASAAILFSASPNFKQYLKDQVNNKEDIVALVARRNYRTIINSEGHFTIQPLSPSPDAGRIAPEWMPNSTEQSWKPMATRKWFVGCILILPLALIAVLEVLQNISDRNQGFVSLRSSGDHHLTALYIPVLTMLLVTAMFDTLNFAASVFAPFSALRRRDSPAKPSIATTYISRLPLHALFIALGNHHWAVFLAVLAALISSFLTIVASGLYSSHELPALHEIQVRQTGLFNLTHMDVQQYDSIAGATAKLNILHNLSYPSWTFKDLVFPSFDSQYPELPTSDNDTADYGFVEVSVPALRPSLDCHLAESDVFSEVEAYYWADRMEVYTEGVGQGMVPTPGVQYRVAANFTGPQRFVNSTSNTTTYTVENLPWWSFFILPNDTETSFANVNFGVASPLEWTGSQISSTAMQRVQKSDVDPLSPSFGIMAGIATGRKTNKFRQMTQYSICYQVLEEIQTTIPLSWPSMTIRQSPAPSPDEDTARIIMSDEISTPNWFMSTPANQTSNHWFGISLNTFMWSLQDTLDTAQTLNAWYTTIEASSESRNISKYLGKDNMPALLKESNRLYAAYAVQAISANMRSTQVQPGQEFMVYNATLETTKFRLKQNKQPKIVLQVLLGVMTVCGAIVYITTNMKNLIRRNPCSIAGKMELFIHSELCESKRLIPEGAEWWSEKERKERGLFAGYLFSLSWGDKGSRPYGIDVSMISEK